MFPVGVYNVEDYPLNWIDGTYYSTYKGNTFQVSSIENVKSEADYAAVTTISLTDQSLTTDFTFKLLGKFENLTVLILKNNNIDTIDFSNSENLTSLEINENAFITVDLSNLTNLLLLHIQNNTALTSLDVSNNILLQELRAFNCPLLVTVDLSNLSDLSILYIYDNPLLASLDVSNNVLLEELRVFNCPLITSLNIDNNVVLNELNTTDTGLSFVSITNNILLTSIRLHSQTEANFLTNLNDIITHGNSNGFLGYELDANTMQFDGLGQGVTLTSSISLTGDFTIEFILYYTASGHLFVDTTGSDRISISGSQIRFEISGANVSINAGLETSKVLRIRIERSGSDIDIYKDNVLQGSGTWANTQIINAFAKKRGAATTVPSLEGYLKDITIDDAGTVYYWAGDEGTGVTITESNQGNDGTFDGTWNGLLTDVTGLSQVQTLQSNGWTVVSFN